MGVLKLFNRRANTISWARCALVACALHVHTAFGLDPAKSVFQFNCRSWGCQNGLPASVISAIRQTDDGYLWLGTSRGLVRFDGVQFELFEPKNPQASHSVAVMCLAPASIGGLWFGLDYGSFGYFDGRTAVFPSSGSLMGETVGVRAVLEARNGDLWIASEIFAGRLTRNNAFEPVLTTAPGSGRYDVTALFEDSQGRIWLGTARRGLFYWQDGALKKLDDPVFDGLTPRAIVEDNQGMLWIGTDWGLLCYNAALERQPFPHPWHPVRALLVDGYGTLWIGTTGAGLIRYRNGVTSALRQANGLADDFVTALATDTEECLWVGTRNGLTQVTDVKIPIFSKAEGLPAQIIVSVSATRNGKLMLATDSGFTLVDDIASAAETARHYSKEIGLPNAYITRVFEAKDGDVYLIDGGMNVLIVSQGAVVACYTNKTWPTAFAEDAQSVLVAIGGELYRVGRNFFEPCEFVNGQKLPFNWIFCIAEGRDGTVWVAGDEGICKIKDGAFELWTRTNGLPNSKVRWIFEDDTGTVWVGLETAGIARLKHGQIRTITTENGLYDDITTALIADEHGYLWVDSGRGIYRVSIQALNDFTDGKIKRVECLAFDSLGAIKSAEKFQQWPSVCKTADGHIWLPTAQGVAMINPTNLTFNPVPPRVHIQRVCINGREIDKAAVLTVPAGKGELEVQYTALSYKAPHKILFRYKLEGFDRDWVQAGARRTAYYTNLKPGTYRFWVQACNEDGVWNLTGDCVRVGLTPRFYQTNWFIIMVGVGILLGAAALHRWRLWRTERKQRQLEETKQQLEAEVAKRTADLAEANELLKSEIEERKHAEEQVERTYMQLLRASRLAGQAEVASSVLHNIGNVLNSVNVSTYLVADRLRKLPVQNMTRAIQMLQEHNSHLAEFLTKDSRGRLLPQYLGEVAALFAKELDSAQTELKDLAQKVEHMKETISLQQSAAKLAGAVEPADLAEVVETALKLHANAYQRHGIEVVREYEKLPHVTVDRHRVLQVLVNLLHNAKYACDETDRADKKVIVRIKSSNNMSVRIEVADNGIGIAPENLSRIFQHGFTTRKDGHGFGLYSSAIAARELGGMLTAHSDGPGKGSTFVLELPICPKTDGDAVNSVQPVSAGECAESATR